MSRLKENVSMLVFVGVFGAFVGFVAQVAKGLFRQCFVGVFVDFVGVARVAKVYIVGVFEDFVGVARMAKVYFVGVFMDFVGVALRGWRQKVTRNRSSSCQKSALPS